MPASVPPPAARITPTNGANVFAIQGKVNRARSAAGTYQIQSVPTFIVDGKFTTYKVASHQATPAALDAMIAKARAERPKS